ncbi:MAG: hypothetical protein J6N51_12170 [Selenomonas sp.]|nr:hypothetical protein [Selenomonas sp.]
MFFIPSLFHIISDLIQDITAELSCISQSHNQVFIVHLDGTDICRHIPVIVAQPVKDNSSSKDGCLILVGYGCSMRHGTAKLHYFFRHTAIDRLQAIKQPLICSLVETPDKIPIGQVGAAHLIEDNWIISTKINFYALRTIRH